MRDTEEDVSGQSGIQYWDAGRCLAPRVLECRHHRLTYVNGEKNQTSKKSDKKNTPSKPFPAFIWVLLSSRWETP